MNLEELAKWFFRKGGRASFEVLQDEGLQPYALAKRGWIQGEPVGRWGMRYVPAGDLAEAYARLKSENQVEFMAAL